MENAEQLEHLMRMGCDLVQGHYLARPMPGVEVRPAAGEPAHLLENRSSGGRAARQRRKLFDGPVCL